MTDQPSNTDFKSGLDFVDDSSLSYFIPLATSFQIDESLKDSEKTYQEVFDSIERRENLFFGRQMRILSRRSILTVLIPRPQMNPSMFSSSLELLMWERTPSSPP
ncbi:hypothetical protein F5X99DRAFT_20298 [Biscogniauxia marginata]|nr:hypothetical protein F5X99DRAFT_20298 [Biscogniauxia marginata]